jgi:hypothetical protein
MELREGFHEMRTISYKEQKIDYVRRESRIPGLTS